MTKLLIATQKLKAKNLDLLLVSKKLNFFSG